MPDEDNESNHANQGQPVPPARVLRLLLMVALLLALVVILVPTGSLSLSEDLQLRFVSLDALLGKQRVEYADIQHILESHQEASETAATPTPQPPPRKDIDSLTQQLEEIDNPEALAPFFAQLKARDKGPELIRILHYGDSQIEGDRITGYIREQFQKEFGGCGVGMLPLYDQMPSRASAFQSSEGKWRQFVPYGKRPEDTPHNRYGVLGVIQRYGEAEPALDDPEAPVRPSPGQTLQAVSRVKKSRLAFPRARSFEVLRMLSGNAPPGVHFVVRIDGEEAFSGQLEPGLSLDLRSWPLSGEFEEVEIEFESQQSPDFFALALDCPKGVAVDNIPLRGSSGVFVHRIDVEAFGDQIEALDGRLIIWQFGVNVIPYLTDNFEFYEGQLRRSLQLLRRALPEVPILVVGVSDIARKGEGDFYESYPNVEGVRDAQRQAALSAGCAFWDLFEAMGGKHSMPSWVLHEPSLATTDFTHFNPRGARIVARMLYKALQKAQEDWAAQVKEGS